MSEKILIADDEPSNRKILEQELVHKGFAVDTARGGKEALAKIESVSKCLRRFAIKATTRR
jgi:CheY-like chemotaxis protein